MLEYDRKIDDLFNQIGFDNYKTMLKTAWSDDKIVGALNLLSFKTGHQIIDPVEFKPLTLTISFTIIQTKEHPGPRFYNIFAFIAENKDNRLRTIAEIDYWGNTNNYQPLNRKEIIQSIIEDLKRYRIREKFGKGRKQEQKANQVKKKRL